MQFYKISLKDQQEAEKLFTTIGAEETGSYIMSKKAFSHALFIKDLHVGAANILKQDALSIGADLVVPTGTILAKDKFVDAILLGTTKHFYTLSRKELAQPFGLKDLAKELTTFVQYSKNKTRIMGIINANDDSFFDGSRFKGDEAIERIHSMIAEGADIIDIGGVSTRPGSDMVDEKEELRRIAPICDLIKQEKINQKVLLSIDSFTPSVIEYALESGFQIVNDITGLENDEVARITAKHGATIVIMHMQGKPKDMQHNPSYDNVVLEVDEFFKERIAKAKEFGIEDIILDVGIGFGKTLEHNLTLLKNTEHFLHFGYKLLIGASRKTLIDKITPADIGDRLPGTLAIHLDSVRRGSSIVRCHDVKEHYQALQVQKAIQDQTI